MDVWLKFSHASKLQCEEIFRRFFSPLKNTKSKTLHNTSDQYTDEEIGALARRFAEEMPSGKFSVSLCSILRRLVVHALPRQIAAIQGYLLMHKERPLACIDGIRDWCVLVHIQSTLI